MHSRLSGAGATTSKRSSAATQWASAPVRSTCRRIIVLHGRDAVGAQREPQLQRAEPPAERHLPVAVVDRRAGLGRRRAQVLGQDAQRPEQGPTVGRVEQVAVEDHAHPLVRVGAVAVGQLQPVVDPALLGHQRTDPAHRRVDVQPHALATGDHADRLGRVEGHRRRRPARRAHPERDEPGGAVGGDLLGERVGHASRTSRRAPRCASASVPMPAMRSPFSMLECACDVAYATSLDVSPSTFTAAAR